jgi:AcrR family transcriptional regulator
MITLPTLLKRKVSHGTEDKLGKKKRQAIAARGRAAAGPRRRAASVRSEDEAEPRGRILAAAEQVFAEHGFDAATLRQITEVAGVNIAAVNYYFDSKEALVQQVLDRRMGPYLTARLTALETREAAAGRRPLDLEEIVEALVRPMVELSKDPSGGGRSLIRLILQVRARPSEDTVRVFIDRVDPVVERYIEAFRRATPALSDAELYWRYNFAIGAVMQVLTDADPAARRLTRLSGGLCDTDDDEAIVSQLVAFVSSGFRHPTPPPKAVRLERRAPATAAKG